jgi:hypothetical protein
MHIPDTISVQFIIHGSLGTESRINTWLNSFDSDILTAQNWGRDENERLPYDVLDIHSYLDKYGIGPYVFRLGRTKSPRFNLYSGLDARDLNYVAIEFKKFTQLEQIQQVYSLFANLCRNDDPEYAFIHPLWKIDSLSQEYAASGILSVTDYASYGPKPIQVQTWLGRRIMKLISLQTLQDCGLLIDETLVSGSTRVSFMPNPWNASLDAIEKRQEEVMSFLEPTGIFGNYTGKFGWGEPGAKWQKIPLNPKSTGLIIKQ